MEKKYRILFSAIFIVVLIFVFFFNHKPVLAPESNQAEFKNIKINSVIINAEIADTSAKQMKGLSGRQSLAENSGMLFVFSTPDFYSFWMKDMNFPLDFVWISGDTVAEITSDVKPPGSEPLQILTPKEEVDKVLELNAGAVERLNIKVGDKIEIN